ncbi:hypothetical protein Bca101_057498 [Brassica carinata]
MSAPEKDFPPLQMVEKKRMETGNEGKKASWVQVAQNGGSLSEHVLTVGIVDGKEIVEVPDNVIQDSVPLWDDLLEGKFLSTAPHIAKIHAIVNKIWPLGNESIRIEVFEVDSITVKFRIKDKNTRNRIVKRGMWNICNIPMVVTKWSPEEEEEEEQEIKVIPMWITMKSVPQKMFSWKGLSFIASAVGKPKRLHPETILCKSFVEAKVFVEADVTKELPKTHHFKSKLGVDAEVQFEYPWLPHRCNICSKWGHLGSACGNKKKQIRILQREKEKEIEGHSTMDQTAVVPFEQNSAIEDQNVAVTQRKEVLAALITTEGDLSESNKQNAEETLEEAVEEVTGEVTEEVGKPPSEGTNEVEVSEYERELVTEKENWLDVSPLKKGRSTGKKSGLSPNKIVGSPSRFAVLDNVSTESTQSAVEKLQADSEGESEEGEILEDKNTTTQAQIEKPEGNVEEKEETQVRRTSIRASRGINKNSAENFALSTRESLPSAAGKKRNHKKK